MTLKTSGVVNLAVLGCTGKLWAVVPFFLGVAGFYLDVLCFNWLCFAALGFTGL